MRAGTMKLTWQRLGHCCVQSSYGILASQRASGPMPNWNFKHRAAIIMPGLAVSELGMLRHTVLTW
eukprot:3593433-Amphidinium_carterae.1